MSCTTTFYCHRRSDESARAPLQQSGPYRRIKPLRRAGGPVGGTSNIVGIKDSGGDMSLTSEYTRRTDDDFAVLLRDTLIYAGLLHGAKGAIAASANIVPALVVEIY